MSGGGLYFGSVVGIPQTQLINLTNNLFLSLSSTFQGGAIYTELNVVINQCKFINNSVEKNNLGNDIFVFKETDFYYNPSNFVSDCSWSSGTNKFVIRILIYDPDLEDDNVTYV
jgi:predicted outer membrane repeat protein